MSDSVNYITIDIDEFETFIDNLLEEQKETCDGATCDKAEEY